MLCGRLPQTPRRQRPPAWTALRDRAAASNHPRGPHPIDHLVAGLTRPRTQVRLGARASSPDRSYYLQVAERIDHNRARLSVARKLCRRAYHILRELGEQALAPIDQPAAQKETIAAAA